MIAILVAYTCLIIILTLIQRFINKYTMEHFVSTSKNNDDIHKETGAEKLDKKSIHKDKVSNKSLAEQELDESLKINLVKKIKDVENNHKNQGHKNIKPKYGNNTPKFHKPSKDLYNAYGWTKMPPQSWSVIQKPPPNCISNTPKSEEPISKEGYPLDQLDDPINVKLVDTYPKKTTGYMNMLKPVLLL